MIYPKLTYRDDHDSDLKSWNRWGECPSCGSADHIEAATGVEDYIDDEDMLMTQYGPRHHPYKDFVCEKCGATFRIFWGAVKIELLEEDGILA
jgi:hypothetical protein